MSAGLTDRVACDAAPPNPAAVQFARYAVAELKALALRSVAKAHARKPCAVSRKKASWVCTPTHFVRNRAARYPPMADDITATITRYIPVPVLKLDAEMPLSLQGDTADRPSPAPNAIKTRASAAAATAPAAMAAHDTAACASTIVDAGRSDSISVSGRDAICPA